MKFFMNDFHDFHFIDSWVELEKHFNKFGVSLIDKNNQIKDIDQLIEEMYDNLMNEISKSIEKELVSRKKSSSSIKTVEKTKSAENAKKVNSNKKSQTIKLSPPWTTVEKKIKALFNGDEDITIKPIKRLADGNLELSLEGPDACKMIALNSIMKTKYNFGNFNLNLVFKTTDGKDINPIEVDEWFDDLYGVYEDAFCSTPAVIDVKNVQPKANVADYVMIEFKKEVVQFFNDDLTDYYGNWNGLYTDIAKELLNDNLFVKYTIAEK